MSEEEAILRAQQELERRRVVLGALKRVIRVPASLLPAAYAAGADRWVVSFYLPFDAAADGTRYHVMVEVNDGSGEVTVHDSL